MRRARKDVLWSLSSNRYNYVTRLRIEGLALCVAVMCAAGAWAIDGRQLRLVAADGTFLGTLGSEYD